MNIYTIKKLDWRDNGFSGLLADPFGPFTYHICFISGVQWSVTRSNVCGSADWVDAQDKLAAMEACQSHYETELQSVLKPIAPATREDIESQRAAVMNYKPGERQAMKPAPAENPA